MKAFFSFQGSTGVLFEDIAGIDDVVEELQEASTNFLDSMCHRVAMGPVSAQTC